ncbi:MAG: TrkH family potassium uptake protein [Clostridia bacterium]|nr:TrkH family potassium uptake protein [Clostridia bacterium]
MNKRLTIHLVGNVVRLAGGLMILPLIVSLIHGGSDAKAILIAMVITAVAGSILALIRPRRDVLRAREGFAVVALSWILVSFFGGLPFFFHGCIPSLMDCFFETVSGFTTTGATILTDVEALPKGLLFWRSFTHWAGGMGVLVLSLALIPKMGARSIHLMRAESPGPSTDKLVPRVSNNAKILYEIYVGLSALMVIALLLCGMNLFDALVHMFGAAGTGGFGTYGNSIAHWNSAAVDVVIGVFMALFGVNFSLYYYLIRRNWRAALGNSELRLYWVILLMASVLIAINIMPLFRQGYYAMANNAVIPGDANFFTALRYSFFQVSSVMTTTGYATADFNQWPQFSRVLLVVIMFIGASAGSTGGGMKVIRLQLLVKSMVRDIRQTIHPKSVNTVKLDGHTVSENILSGVQGFFFAYMAVLLISTIIVSLDGFSFETNFTAVVATLSNIGPGLGMVGPTGNFAAFSNLSKLVLSMCMLIGRLEIFPILMLFAPSAYKR